MSASRHSWPPSNDEFRRRLRSRVRYDRMWAPDEPQLELFSQAAPRHVGDVLDSWLGSRMGGTAAA